MASLKLEELDTEIKLGWVNRWMIEGLNRDKTGSSVLFELGKGRPEHLGIKKLGRNTLPCMESIALAWNQFRKKYNGNESNIYEAVIFLNTRQIFRGGVPYLHGSTKYVHIKSTTVYAPPRNWDSPQPPTRRLVCPLPPVSGGRGTLAGEKGVGRVPIPTRGIHCGTLYMYILCAWIVILSVYGTIAEVKLLISLCLR